MKTSSLISVNKKNMVVCFILLIIHSSGYSQNKLASMVTSVNFNFAVPVICVVGLAVFLLTAFIKQKNH